MRRLTLIAIAASLLTCSACRRAEVKQPVADPASRRVIWSGEVLGFVSHYGSHAWLGIPYAAPPVGDLRWRAPRPPGTWAGTHEALAFGSPCVQYSSIFGGVATAPPGQPVGSEDCLYLNVWAPRFDAAEVPTGEKRLPVMVWIHGGGNTIGEGGFYDGGNLAATEDVIVITFNYRLGPFGWFRHASLRGAGTSDLDRSGNFGTLDLVRALEWVRDNISAFGGDPGNVTVFGESAGGTNTYTMLLSPQAHGLFHRAIVESGGLGFSDVTSAENFTDDAEAGAENSSNEVLLRLLQRDGAGDRAAAKARLAAMSAAEVESYLRGKKAFDLLTVYTPMPGAGMFRMPKVFRDGVVLPSEEPMQALSRPDGYNHVPVILGTNRDENKLFMFNDPHWVRKFLWIIPRLRDEKMYNVTAEYLAKMWKANGADEPAAAMAASGAPGVWVYRFDWDEEPHVLGADLSMMLGAAHGFEIPFVFGHFELGKAGDAIFTEKNAPGRQALSAEMMSYWAQLAYSGNPGRGRDGSLPEWKRWQDAGPGYIVFDTPEGGGLQISRQTVTAAAVLGAVEADPRLTSPRERCMVYHDLATWSVSFSSDDYASREPCADYPYDKYPW